MEEKIKVKDAICMVPIFTGTNISVYDFLDRIDDAAASIKTENEILLVRFIKTKLEGEARTLMSNYKFNTIKEIKDRLKQLFSNLPSIESLYRKLSMIRQKTMKKSTYMLIE